jgi:nucleotide-binding universal stress UspA family protein
MNLSQTPIPLTDRRQDSQAPERAVRWVPQSTHPRRLAAGAITVRVDDRDLHAGPVVPAGAFSAVLCGVDGSANARAARDQGELLASPGGTVKVVPAQRLTEHGPRALYDDCDGHDLITLGGGAGAHWAVKHAPIPILIARSCPLGTKVTDTILVPVDDSPDSSRAVELAGRIAAVHGGTVTILRAPPRDAALQRALNASSRVLLHATGAVPRVYGEQPPRERVIPSAASALTASLVVVGSGSSDTARRMTAQIVGSTGCSVLVVPAPQEPSGEKSTSVWDSPELGKRGPDADGFGSSFQ